MEIELNKTQIDNLKRLIEKLKPDAQRVGPLHGNWDLIFDAEALILGQETFKSGNKQEVYEFLIGKELSNA